MTSVKCRHARAGSKRLSEKRWKVSGELTNGIQYLWPWARIGPPPKIAEDTNLQEQVWSWLEEQVKAFEGSV
jgi:hypothetical protein